jgi:hypothetical protein
MGMSLIILKSFLVELYGARITNCHHDQVDGAPVILDMDAADYTGTHRKSFLRNPCQTVSVRVQKVVSL